MGFGGSESAAPWGFAFRQILLANSLNPKSEVHVSKWLTLAGPRHEDRLKPLLQRVNANPALEFSFWSNFPESQDGAHDTPNANSKARITPMMLSPAMQPEAMGMV